MKNKTVFTYIVAFVVLSLTIGYSAFGSELLVSNLVAEVRVEADVRVTEFLYNGSTGSGSSSYETYDVDSVISTISLPNIDSSVSYKIEVTNFGNTEMGILNINGLPSNLIYEISDYTLKDKICDSSGKCTLGAVKEFYITIKYGVYDSMDTLYDLKLDFDFRGFYSVEYIGISNNNYPVEVMSGDNLKIIFGSDAPSNVYVMFGNSKVSDYTYENGILNTLGVSGNVIIQAPMIVGNYSYSGTYDTLTVPYTGIYRIELWGASGSYSDVVVSETVGKGGYTAGTINLKKGISIFFYVGGSSSFFNGAGIGEVSGGGASDVRLVKGEWSDFNSLKSRIMVAGAGGAGVIGYFDGVQYTYEGDSPGDGGGLVGYDANYNAQSSGYGYSGYGGGQTSGGNPGKESFVYEIRDIMYGHFGKGGYQNYVLDNGIIAYQASGGGSGYYGGGHGVHPGNAWPGAGGGSSFISGHNGCDAVTLNSSEDNIEHTRQSVHYSGYKFTDTVMIDGRGYSWTNTKGDYVGMPTYDGKSTMVGNVGDGYAKITFLEITEK